MIAVIKPSATAEQKAGLVDWIRGQGIDVHISEGHDYTVLGLIGDTSKIDMDLIASLDIVDSVKRVAEPFKQCSRKFHPDDTAVEVGGVKIGGGHFAMIAGPCSVESREQIITVARAVQASGAKLLRGGAFKPRTSPYDFQGLKAEGITIVIVTHNMQQAARVSDSTAFFYMGEMVEFGDTKKIFTNPDKVETQNYITGRFG